MKKIKILFLLLFMFLLTGCSGTYNIKINKDFSIKENAEFNIPNKDENTYDKTIKIFTDNKISKKKYKVKILDDNIRITYNETYESIDDYILNSKLYHEFFNDIDYTYKDGLLSFKADTYLALDNNKSQFIYNNFDVPNVLVNIETPFKIKSSNADLKEEKRLSWSFESDTKEKSIDVEYNVVDSRNNTKDIIVLSLVLLIIVGSVVVIIIRFYNGRKI